MKRDIIHALAHPKMTWRSRSGVARVIYWQVRPRLISLQNLLRSRYSGILEVWARTEAQKLEAQK